MIKSLKPRIETIFNEEAPITPAERSSYPKILKLPGISFNPKKNINRELVYDLNGNLLLSLNDRDILNHAGKISHELAVSKAETEYERFNQMRIGKVDQEDGDFEKAVKLIEGKSELGKRGKK